ncbi:uncharacterized protein LOC109861429 [Pseudomyrmex gracilis]|uniref:uncharacterized protein LOC109861429 n=1 Tax=Pseudomyrmex gracilis TaxID=219809 RepID=UPI000994FC31|nr:uncharacterized protein LOC109861429 [Pseudomyrmex gracilis]
MVRSTKDSRTTQMKMLLIKVVTVLTFCVAWSEAGDQEYHIRKFQHNFGVYYEKYGTMLYASEKWRLVVRLDVSTVYTRTERTERMLDYTTKACENAAITRRNRELCEGFAAELRQRLQKVEKIVKRVKTIVGTQKRRQRGLVNALGSVAKILFGTMDAEDEKRVSEQVELLNKKLAVLQHVVKNQLQVINATIAHVENIEEVVERNENKFKNAIIKITQKVDSYAQQAELSEYFMELGSMITELEFDVESIMGYVTDVQAKFAQLEMVPVELIIKGLQDANNWSAHGLHFPFVITLENWLTIKEYVTQLACSVKTQMCIPSSSFH